jgi:hypothetical protein
VEGVHVIWTTHVMLLDSKTPLFKIALKVSHYSLPGGQMRVHKEITTEMR